MGKVFFWQEQTAVGSGNHVASSERPANPRASSERDGWVNGVVGGLIANVSTPAKIIP